MRSYYRVRPLLTRGMQINLRRLFARYQARSRFSRWPIETALHDFFDLMFALLGEVAGRPIPRIAAWPSGFDWALVLTHDVEHAEGVAALDPILELSDRMGCARRGTSFQVDMTFASSSSGGSCGMASR